MIFSYFTITRTNTIVLACGFVLYLVVAPLNGYSQNRPDSRAPVVKDSLAKYSKKALSAGKNLRQREKILNPQPLPLQQQEQLMKGQNLIRINMQKFSAGQYLLQTVSGEIKWSEKVLKQ